MVECKICDKCGKIIQTHLIPHDIYAEVKIVGLEYSYDLCAACIKPVLIGRKKISPP